MSLLGFLTGIGSLFNSATTSANSGDSSTSGSSTSAGTIQQGTTSQAIAKQHTTTNADVYGSSNSNTQAKATQTTNESGSTTNVGQSATTQAGTEKTKQSQETTMYSSDILAAMDNLLKTQLASGSSEQAAAAQSGRLQQISTQAGTDNFDVGGFVQGITSAAAVSTQSDLDSRINDMLSKTGSSETGNSMSALLGNKLRNDAAANLAGIASQAYATGEQIAGQKQTSYTDQIDQLSSGLSTSLTALLGAAQGGRQTTTGTGETLTGQTSKTVDSAQQNTQGTSTTSGTSQSATQDRTTQLTREQQTLNESKNEVAALTQKENVNKTANSTTDAGGSNSGIFDNLFNTLAKSAATA